MSDRTFVRLDVEGLKRKRGWKQGHLQALCRDRYGREVLTALFDKFKTGHVYRNAYVRLGRAEEGTLAAKIHGIMLSLTGSLSTKVLAFYPSVIKNAEGSFNIWVKFNNEQTHVVLTIPQIKELGLAPFFVIAGSAARDKALAEQKKAWGEILQELAS